MGNAAVKQQQADDTEAAAAVAAAPTAEGMSDTALAHAILEQDTALAAAEAICDQKHQTVMSARQAMGNTREAILKRHQAHDMRLGRDIWVYKAAVREYVGANETVLTLLRTLHMLTMARDARRHTRLTRDAVDLQRRAMIGLPDVSALRDRVDEMREIEAELAEVTGALMLHLETDAGIGSTLPTDVMGAPAFEGAELDFLTELPTPAPATASAPNGAAALPAAGAAAQPKPHAPAAAAAEPKAKPPSIVGTEHGS
jgi:hypothetical protein